MCVVGEEDGSTPPELVLEMANMIPGADFKLIKGLGIFHGTTAACPGRYADRLYFEPEITGSRIL